MQNWQLIPQLNLENINYTGTVLHQLVQIVTMFSHGYLHHEDDDSHNNLGWDHKKRAITSHSTIIPHVHMSLNLDRFCINVATDNSNEFIPIENSTISQSIEKCRTLLDLAGFNGDDFQQITHFEITSLPFGNDEEIKKPDQKYLSVWSALWSNSFDLLTRINKGFQKTSDVRIWPHHFDVGLLLPLDHDSQGNITKSMGLGLAIADTMINEPYYYLSYWSSDNGNINIPEKLKSGGFMPSPENWNGYALPISSIIKETNVNNQEIKSIAFFKEGIAVVVDQLNMSEIKFNGINRL